MKLILLYGPPAVGKLTIALALSKLIKVPLLHNHLFLNPLKDVFGFDHPARSNLENEFRQRIVSEAIRFDIDLIMTGVIVDSNSSQYYKIISDVEARNGATLIVRLTSPASVLTDRIDNKFRKTNRKISTREDLASFQNE